MIHYSDELEKLVGDTLAAKGITAIHGSQPGANQRLDFHLPDYGVYIEVKKYHTTRSTEQLATQDNVILLQGAKAVQFFCESLNDKT